MLQSLGGKLKFKKTIIAATIAASGSAGYLGYDEFGPRKYFGYNDKLQIIEIVTHSKNSFNANGFQKPGLIYEEDQKFHTMEYDPNAFQKLMAAMFNFLSSCVSAPPSNPIPSPEPNPTPIPKPPQPQTDWGAIKIQAPQANEIFKTPKKVCIVDTGIDANHPFLKPHVKFTKSFTGQNSAAERFGHGTHVAGIVVQGNNSAELYVMQGLSDIDGSGNLSDLGQALLECAAQGAEVINNSWGGGTDSPYLNQIIASLVAKGIRIGFAAGNESTQTSYPATLAGTYSTVFSISATNQQDMLAIFSNYGLVSFAAPGDNIRSTLPTYGCELCDGNRSGWGLMRGSSMAAPYAVAVISMVTKRPVQTDNIGSATYFGQGRVNALKTVQ